VLAAVQAAADRYELTVEDVLTPGKWHECVRARRMAMVSLREQGWTLPRIARAFRVDHTTVLYHCKQAAKAALLDAQDADRLPAPADPRRPASGE
jgi:chromosomal replication initiation ATPase DnaA